jgi:hypothetical protein
MNKRLFSSKVHEIGIAIKGALGNSEILNRLEPFGYTAEKITEGKELLDRVNQLTAHQVLEYGNQYGFTDEQEIFFGTTYGKYMVAVKISRIAFKNQPDILSSLKVIGERPRSMSGWLHSARILYTNLLELPNAFETISRYGYTEERIKKELQDVETVEELRLKQLRGRSAAQTATRKRDEAFDELCNWFSDFRAIVRIALYDNPQLLEAIGLKN